MARLGSLGFGRIFVLLVLVNGLLLSGCGMALPFAQNSVGGGVECPPVPTLVPYDEDPTSLPGRPTPAPPPPSSQPPPVFTPTAPPTLVNALTTHEQLLERAYELTEHMMPLWEEPWCVATLQTDPDRFLFQRYETVKQATGGWSPEGVIEPVWIVTIRGTVAMGLPGWGARDKPAYISYTIGENSGLLYETSMGGKFPPRTRQPVTPRPSRTRDPNRTRRPTRSAPTNTRILLPQGTETIIPATKETE